MGGTIRTDVFSAENRAAMTESETTLQDLLTHAFVEHKYVVWLTRQSDETSVG